MIRGSRAVIGLDDKVGLLESGWNRWTLSTGEQEELGKRSDTLSNLLDNPPYRVWSIGHVFHRWSSSSFPISAPFL